MDDHSPCSVKSMLDRKCYVSRMEQLIDDQLLS